MFIDVLSNVFFLDLLSSFVLALHDRVCPVPFHVTGRDKHVLQSSQSEVVMRLGTELFVAQFEEGHHFAGEFLSCTETLLNKQDSVKDWTQGTIYITKACEVYTTLGPSLDYSGLRSK